MGFRTTGTFSSLYIAATVGTAYGGPYGFAAGTLVGGTFTAGEMAWDGVVWFGDQVSQAAGQFNNAWRSGWVPGKR